MFKKILKSVVTMESIFSLVLNIIQLPIIKIGIDNDKILIVSFSFLTLLIGLYFMINIIIKSVKKMENYNSERKEIESLKSFIIDNTDNYKKSEYYVLNPINYKGIFPFKNAPKQIQNNLKNIDFEDYDKISVEKEKEYFIIKFLEKNPELSFKKIKRHISKVYYELGRDKQ